jgi:hypothetical protein
MKFEGGDGILNGRVQRISFESFIGEIDGDVGGNGVLPRIRNEDSASLFRQGIASRTQMLEQPIGKSMHVLINYPFHVWRFASEIQVVDTFRCTCSESPCLNRRSEWDGTLYTPNNQLPPSPVRTNDINHDPSSFDSRGNTRLVEDVYFDDADAVRVNSQLTLEGLDL